MNEHVVTVAQFDRTKKKLQQAYFNVSIYSNAAQQ
jgi:hypothetical protein